MIEERGYIEQDERELVFGSMSVLVPGRKVEVGFAVRKKSDFPVVQEQVLKLLRMVGGSSLELLVTFFDFSEREIREVLRPLLDKGFVIMVDDEYRLSDMGSSLFSSSDGAPAISESESLERNFRVDDHCGLPVIFDDLGRHVKTGGLKWFIAELPVDPKEDLSPNEKALMSFNRSFEHFIKNENDLEKVRSENMILHKTEYCKTKEGFVIRADVLGIFSRSAIVSNHVVPFDDLLPKTDDRRKLREQLIERVKAGVSGGSDGDVEFLRDCFGEDFLQGCVGQGVVAWFKVIPQFFNQDWPRLASGARLIIGEACLSRNIAIIVELFEKIIAEREVSIEVPLKIIWVRPAVVTWGRSIGILEAIDRLRETSRLVSTGAVQIELWENRRGFEGKTMVEQRSYRPWFDDLRRFTSDKIPPDLEMLLIGDSGGLVLTHAFTPPQACFPCPIGVYFEEHAAFQEIMKLEVHGGLRSLPRLEKKRNRSKGDDR
jgi:hypothetical protein